jgi:hypothetical protein
MWLEKWEMAVGPSQLYLMGNSQRLLQALEAFFAQFERYRS